MTASQSTLQVDDLSQIQVGFKLSELAAAKVVVKHLVRMQARKGPTDLLVLPDSALEKWYDEDAAAYLREQMARRHPTIEVK